MRHIILLLALFTFGCIADESPPRFPVGEVEGYRPVYTTDAEGQITFLASQPLVEPGKIYTYGKLLLVNERFRGVHVFDNSDPKSPNSLGFISIPGNVDIALKENILYADHGNDVIALDISNITEPVEKDRIVGAFKQKFSLPNATNTYFECIDPARSHLVAGWEKVKLTNPECYK